MPPADNLCKQFETRSGSTECRAWSGSKLFDTHDIPERVLREVDFEKKSADYIQKKNTSKITQQVKS